MGGEQRAAMEDQDRETWTQREEGGQSFISHIHTVADVQLLQETEQRDREEMSMCMYMHKTEWESDKKYSMYMYMYVYIHVATYMYVTDMHDQYY